MLRHEPRCLVESLDVVLSTPRTVRGFELQVESMLAERGEASKGQGHIDQQKCP
jgi:hypothetical protein